MTQDVSDLLFKGAAQLGVRLTPGQLDCFDIYLRELNRWRKKINLMSREDDREIVIKDFLDSLTLVRQVSSLSDLLDLGSGAGFPGMPLKIALPELRVCFLEATRKKVFFLKEVQRLLHLDGVEIRWTGEDRGVEDLFSRFDAVVSRAFGSLPEFVRQGIGFLRQGGFLVAMKGKKGKEELEEALPFLGEMKLQLGFLETLRLPFLHHERTLIGLVKN